MADAAFPPVTAPSTQTLPLPGPVTLFLAQLLLTAIGCIAAIIQLARGPVPQNGFFDPAALSPWPSFSAYAALADDPVLFFCSAFLALTVLACAGGAWAIFRRSAKAPLASTVLCFVLCFAGLLALLLQPWSSVSLLLFTLSSLEIWGEAALFLVSWAAWGRYFESSSAVRLYFGRKPKNAEDSGRTPPPGIALMQVLCAAVIAANAATLGLGLQVSRAIVLPDLMLGFLPALLPGACFALAVFLLIRRPGTAGRRFFLLSGIWVAVSILGMPLLQLVPDGRSSILPVQDLLPCLALLLWYIKDNGPCRAWLYGNIAYTEGRLSAPVQAEFFQDRIPGLLLVFLVVCAFFISRAEVNIIFAITAAPKVAEQYFSSPQPLPPLYNGLFVLCAVLPLLWLACVASALARNRHTPYVCLLLIIACIAAEPLIVLMSWAYGQEFGTHFLIISMLLAPFFQTGGALCFYIAFFLYLQRSAKVHVLYTPAALPRPASPHLTAPAVAFLIFCAARLLAYGVAALWGTLSLVLPDSIVPPGMEMSLIRLPLSLCAWLLCPALCLLALRNAWKKRGLSGGPAAAADLADIRRSILYWLCCLGLLALADGLLGIPFGKAGSFFLSFWHSVRPHLAPLLAALWYFNTAPGIFFEYPENGPVHRHAALNTQSC